jgi:hypothetical protein
MVQLKKIKIKLNNPARLEDLLQELYSEACQNIEQIQTEMNKLSNSIRLNEEIMDAKTKYAKAMNDYIANKGKAINIKLDIAKLMSEVIKYQGNVGKTLNESDIPGDWDELIAKANSLDNNTEQENKKEEYTIR